MSAACIHVCGGVEFVLRTEHEARMKALEGERNHYCSMWLDELSIKKWPLTPEQSARARLARDLSQPSNDPERELSEEMHTTRRNANG